MVALWELTAGRKVQSLSWRDSERMAVARSSSRNCLLKLSECSRWLGDTWSTEDDVLCFESFGNLEKAKGGVRGIND
jgi:hypothetical protein